jgi:transglutaminase-like putative cysteine protease/sugar lactone lactonase YvrE
MNKYAFVFMIAASATAWGLPGDVTHELPAPGRTCTGLAFDGKLVWVADHSLTELLAVDPSSGRVVRKIKSPGYRPAGLAFDGKQLWCVDTREAKIYRISTTQGIVTRTIPSPVTVPGALAFSEGSLWLSDDGGKSIHRVDPQDGTTIRELPFPGASVDGLAFDGRYLWVADRLADRLYAVHPVSGEVIVTLESPGPYPTGLAFDGKNLVSVDYQTDKISFVKRDDRQFLVRKDPRDLWVVFTQRIRNFGPDPLVKLELFIALPRDLASQKLLEPARFDPRPSGVVTDQWGQKAEHFVFENLQAGASASVKMKVHERAFSTHYVIYPEKVTELRKIPAAIRHKYLANSPKYDLNNPIIKEAVAEALGAERNPYWIARKIYRYVHKHMHYEMVGGWDVAPKVLERGSGSCSEYSFVYIAMCRAAGLPARYAGSLVVRRDDASYDDVFHRWVEVYLPPYGWIPVDPSRGDKPTEAQRADSFGHLYHDFLITTLGGGGSRTLGWNYNYNQNYSCKGRCKVEEDPIAEWSPEDPDAPRGSPANGTKESTSIEPIQTTPIPDKPTEDKTCQ